MIKGLFKRINFFKGLFMKETDWQNEQEYHMEKRRYHNKYLHSHGVVEKCLKGLDSEITNAGRTITVHPGYAVDGHGHDLILKTKKELPIPNFKSFDPPATMYLSIRYVETDDDFRGNIANDKFSGYAYKVEDTLLEISGKEPDNITNMELGRADIIKNPDYPVSGPEWILSEWIKDFFKRAGDLTKARTTPLTVSDLGEKLIDMKVRVIAANKKQEDTNILIEQVPYPDPAKDGTDIPMYMVFVQSLDGVRVRWSIACHKNDEGTQDYNLHIRNEAARSTQVMCRVYKVRP